MYNGSRCRYWHFVFPLKAADDCMWSIFGCSLFYKLSPKFETYECLVGNFNSTQTLHSFPADYFLLAGSPYFSIPEFRLRDKYTFFIPCAFFLIPALLQRPRSVCCPNLGTACSPLHMCLCAGWLGWDSCSSVGDAAKLGIEVCVLLCSVPAENIALAFIFLNI